MDWPAGLIYDAERRRFFVSTEALFRVSEELAVDRYAGFQKDLFQFAFMMSLIALSFWPLASLPARCRPQWVCAARAPRQSPKVLRALVSS